MRKSVHGMHAKRGFTLIEILVVLAIIGITISFAMLAFGDFGHSRRLTISAEQFINYVKLVQQQAVLESSTLGININKNTYEVYRFQTKSGWQRLSKPMIFRKQLFPDNAVITLEKNTKRIENPAIIINASGDMTAFKLHFGTKRQNDIALVIGQHNGSLSLHTAKSS